jgi:hypothetical protein
MKIHRAVGMRKTWCIRTCLNEATGINAQFPISRSVHCALSSGKYCEHNSVADPGCLFRIPDPDFHPSRIPDPKTATKERGDLMSYLFMYSHKFHKIVHYFTFEVLKKKIWAYFQRII